MQFPPAATGSPAMGIYDGSLCIDHCYGLLQDIRTTERSIQANRTITRVAVELFTLADVEINRESLLDGDSQEVLK